MIERLSGPKTHICWTPDAQPESEREIVSLVREKDLAKLEGLINRLSDTEPPSDRELGFCLHCCHKNDAGRNKSRHTSDCVWVEARELLGDKLPE